MSSSRIIWPGLSGLSLISTGPFLSGKTTLNSKLLTRCSADDLDARDEFGDPFVHIDSLGVRSGVVVITKTDMVDEDFAAVAREHSDCPSASEGGDLGKFAADAMVKPFSDALAGMEKGTYTKEPVQTQFGWHVIILDDSRESEVPSFEQVKPQLKMMAQNQRVQDYVASLRSEATIDIVQTAAPAAADTAPAASAPETAAAPGGDAAGETGAAE